MITKKLFTAVVCAATVASGLTVLTEGAAQAGVHRPAVARAGFAGPSLPVDRRAGPEDLDPGRSVVFPTWLFAATDLCAYNQGVRSGRIRVQTIAGADPEGLVLPAEASRCISRWWGAVPINVTNTGRTAVTVWTR